MTQPIQSDSVSLDFKPMMRRAFSRQPLAELHCLLALARQNSGTMANIRVRAMIRAAMRHPRLDGSRHQVSP